MEEDKKKKRKRGIIILCVLCILGIIGYFLYMEYVAYNAYEGLESSYSIELGETLLEDPNIYVVSNETAVSETVLDFSDINFDETGTYEGRASYKDNEVTFEVIISDTMKPQITLVEEIQSTYTISKEVEVNVELDIIVESVTDLSGISSIVVSGMEEELTGVSIEELSIAFTTSGTYILVITAIDNNENASSEEVTFTIDKDYLTYIDGFDDFSFEEGQSVDYLENLTYSEDIIEVVALEETVDEEEPGTYDLTYEITGDDGSVVEVTVEVEVTEKIVVQSTTSSSNNTSSSSNTNSSSSSSTTSSSNSNTTSGSTTSTTTSNTTSGTTTCDGVSPIQDGYLRDCTGMLHCSATSDHKTIVVLPSDYVWGTTVYTTEGDTVIPIDEPVGWPHNESCACYTG